MCGELASGGFGHAVEAIEGTVMTNHRSWLGILAARSCAFGLALTVLLRPALAATLEQIQTACREEARPRVQACMQQKKDAGDRESNLEACKKSVGSPIVRACVQRESKKAAAGKAAPAAPKADAATGTGAVAVPTAFVAPPRTIADITAILDQEMPDPAKLTKLKSDAEGEAPKSKSGRELAQFYYDRGNARALLGRNKEGLADGLRALEAGRGTMEFRQVARIRQFIAIQHKALGDPKQAVAVFQSIVREGDRPGEWGNVINASRNIANILVSMGDVTQADAYARRVASLVQEARGSPLPGWRKWYPVYGNSWESDADAMRAMIFEARGQYREAELAYGRAEAFRRASLKDLSRYEFPPPPEQILRAADGELLAIARVKAKQALLAQAEADARRALLGVLKHQGKYNPQTPRFIVGLANILVEQGRYEEAEKLMRSALEAQRAQDIGDDTPASANILSQLGGVLVLQRKTKEAARIYAELENAIAQWEPRRREFLLLNESRIAALYNSGQLEAGIAAAQELSKRQSARTGGNHIDTASARGTLAVGYTRASRDAEAVREFKAAIPILMAASREAADDDDSTLLMARSQRLQAIVETYIGLLAKSADKSKEVAVETFAMADSVRARSVQRALSASSARMVAKDPALAELVRNEQDFGKQLSAQLGSLNNALALPSGERDENLVHGINAAIEKLRAERDKARAEINRRFPSYADLIDPTPPSVAQIKATLRPDEALLSFYFGQEASFVWAVPKEGPVAFGALPLTALALEAKVRRLRGALEPRGESVDEVPPFDLALAHELYRELLEPVAAGWRSANSLIVVTNGALGLLPLALLPTAPVSGKLPSKLLFDGYRQVAWLARTHAVSQVPSAAALRTLRALPPGSTKREMLIGFGDPYFSAEQAAQAQTADVVPGQVAAATRGVPLKRRAAAQTMGVDSATLALLPRLPDTADELRSVALALEADPAKVLNLGKEANEKKVKATDLARFRIVAFATHGLVPGELDGLTQPALALTAPNVADVDGDGLLTMEEILSLKLDADWVVLSACNTGTGAGAGAEAASGLGRAFFYAGSRALLVTNWSVHSASAAELVTELFRRQSADAGLSRAEALRQAMVTLIDGSNYAEGGKELFSYAHPLFWAPYTIIGDGGVAN